MEAYFPEELQVQEVTELPRETDFDPPNVEVTLKNGRRITLVMPPFWDHFWKHGDQEEIRRFMVAQLRWRLDEIHKMTNQSADPS
jgi:hypothetical protein